MGATREWVRLDIGLLDDERFAGMTADQRGCWVTIYLLLAREGDSVKSLDRLRFLLRRQGVPDLVDDLEAEGWFVPHSRGGLSLRGYEARQYAFHRGPSDDPEAKRERNSKRPTTRAGRRGASVEHRGATPPDPPVREDRIRGATDALAPPTSLKDELKKYGYDPESKPSEGTS